MPGALAALFHDAARPPAQDAEVAAHAARLPREAGHVLELMCGSGRLLLPLLRAGYAMHGVDSSASMLQACEARINAARLEATLVRQDFGELNLPFRYAAALVAAGAFQRLTDDAAVRLALDRIRAHLVAPGVLVLELHVPAASEQRLAAPLVEVRTAGLADGTRIAVRSETVMHPDACIMRRHTRYVHRRGASRLAEETETTTLAWYEEDDIVARITAAGFGRVEIGPGLGPAPHGFEGGRAFSVVARI
jgi:SAM-dependent methyltransferase